MQNRQERMTAIWFPEKGSLALVSLVLPTTTFMKKQLDMVHGDFER